MIRLVIALLVFFPSALSAQLQDRITIAVQPAFPESNTPLSLTAQSISSDLSRALISWYVNGQRVNEGFGEVGASATTGNLGTKTEIRVEVMNEDGTLLTATRTIQPAEIDILWETDSYAPPFYQGRRLASSGALVHAEAVPRFVRPDGLPIATRDIIFSWRKNGTVIAGASGRGKSYASFSSPELFATDTITVEAESIDGSLRGAANILIPSRTPFVLLYQEHPLFGILFHRALSEEAQLPDTEATLVAAPFYAGAVTADDSRLSYEWRVNRASVAVDPGSPSRITINGEGSDGLARVELSVTHKTDFIMEARGLWRIILNNGLGSGVQNIFGEQ